MSPEQWQDFKERLLKAGLELTSMARQRSGFDAERLLGKAQGVSLALSYLNEYQQGAQ